MDNFIAAIRALNPDQSWTLRDLEQQETFKDSNPQMFYNFLDKSNGYIPEAEEETEEFSPAPEKHLMTEINPLAGELSERKAYQDAKEEAWDRVNRGEQGVLLAIMRAMRTEGPTASRVPALSTTFEYRPYEGEFAGDTSESTQEIGVFPSGSNEVSPLLIRTINTPNGAKTTGSEFRGISFGPEQTQRLLRYLQNYGAELRHRNMMKVSPHFLEDEGLRPLSTKLV